MNRPNPALVARRPDARRDPRFKPALLQARLARRAVLFLVLGAMAVARGESAEVRLNLANDFLTSNDLRDDLYTFGLEFGYSFGSYEVSFVENSFTDSVNKLRFDETSLAASRALSPLGGWEPVVSVGMLRIGEGLFGQDAQNTLHNLIGSDKVDLPYIENAHVFPTLGVTFSRVVRLRRDLLLIPRAQLSSSFGFKETSVVSVEAMWQASPAFWLGVELGGRYVETSFGPLRPWIAQTALAWKLSLGLPSNLVVSWDYNRYGTKFRHIGLGYRWNPGSKRATGGPRQR
jgi:hypothetical protein